jgi:hypothetical protein
MQELYLDRAYGCEKGRGEIAAGLSNELTDVIQAEPSRTDDHVALHVIGHVSCDC